LRNLREREQNILRGLDNKKFLKKSAKKEEEDFFNFFI